MNLSGKHDFKGIKRLGAFGLFSLLAQSPFGFLAKGISGKFFMTLFEFIANYAANRGLIFLNVIHDNYTTDKEKDEFIEIMKWALNEVGPGMSEKRIKEIDDKVIEKFTRFASFTRKR